MHFSGGRTSGYLLKHILDAYDGSLPDESVVVFTNTGKEFEETLDFIHEVEVNWSVPVVWLEYEHRGYRFVSYHDAARNGEPFDRLILERGYLPNPHRRLCTQYLKIQTCQKFLVDLWGQIDYTGVVGIRYDEPRRWRLRGQDPKDKHRWVEMPLVDTLVVEQDVLRWWRQQLFNLHLVPGESNCDLCFLKANATRVGIMQRHPGIEKWWIQKEDWIHETRGHVGGFSSPSRKNYRQLYQIAMAGKEEPDSECDLVECNCHD